MIPQIGAEADITQIRIVPYPTFTYRHTDNQIVGNIDELEAIQQAVYHILSTERYAYAIYDNNNGVELEKYRKRGFEYLDATIQSTLQDALFQDDRITAVIVTSIEKTGADSALVKFTVVCSKGTFESEVVVNA